MDVDAPHAARRPLGYLPENVALYNEMRVEEYLRYRARLKGVARSQVGKRVEESLALANIIDVRKRTDEIYAHHTGQSEEQVNRDMERDRFFDPVQAVEYGLIDRVIEHH